MDAVRLAAPAGKLVTVLHVIDPAAQWVEDVKGSGSTNGTTMCGTPMLLLENWQLVEQLPGERICAKCSGEGISTDDAREEAMF